MPRSIEWKGPFLRFVSPSLRPMGSMSMLAKPILSMLICVKPSALTASTPKPASLKWPAVAPAALSSAALFALSSVSTLICMPPTLASSVLSFTLARLAPAETSTLTTSRFPLSTASCSRLSAAAPLLTSSSSIATLPVDTATFIAESPSSLVDDGSAYSSSSVFIAARSPASAWPTSSADSRGRTALTSPPKALSTAIISICRLVTACCSSACRSSVGAPAARMSFAHSTRSFLTASASGASRPPLGASDALKSSSVSTASMWPCETAASSGDWPSLSSESGSA